ncbi:alpha-L-fucosidase [Bacteroidota bacterium]
MNKPFYKKSIIPFLFLAITISCQKAPEPAPVGPVPTEKQLAWQELEFYMFVHFNMNTFTDMEWGMGSESPELFNPTELDCRQWARIARDSGMKGIIITAKHHDGFCLWPTKTTEHSVKNSPWKEGNGDLLKELSEACKEFDLKFGVYLSPWDRNSAHYGTEEYIRIYRDQLRELLTNYGEVFEVWFDGANGGTGYYGGANENREVDRKNYYDWPNTYKIVRDLQPDAVIFSDAADIRWCGNEEGWVNATNWSTLRKNEFWPGVPHYKQLRTGHEDGTHWVPAEVDVSIRPGWYYHPSEDHKVKDLSKLLNIYYHSIGRNGNLLLNFPVDNRGIIHENDEKAVSALAQSITADFARDLSNSSKITATNDRGRGYSADNVLDGNKETYWATIDDVTEASLTIDLGEPTEINRFLAQEYIQLGQRVQEFTLEVLVDDEWQKIAEETTIGYKRILRFDPVQASQVRFSITKAKACPVISRIGLYNAPKVFIKPEISRDKDGNVSLSVYDKSLEIRYTSDGSVPSAESEKYEFEFPMLGKGTIKAIALDVSSGKKSAVAVADMDISKTKWKIVNGEGPQLIRAIDNNPGSTLYMDAKDFPIDLIVDLGEPMEMVGFRYLPDQARWSRGIVFDYEFYISDDMKQWGAPVLKGEFSNIKNNPVWQEKTFQASKGRFIKFRALSEVDNRKTLGIAELGVITK